MKNEFVKTSLNLDLDDPISLFMSAWLLSAHDV